ncbi:hypothetical protein L4D76_00375 [Photobacterium sagamiensis]|uniref:hypothetical protein n=1 Tax=Photobacterium sagamiensis TaxID=2910241 RepID=UPI003D103E5D
MYDTNAVYQTLEDYFPKAEIVIPPKDNTFADEVHHPKRMSNLIGWLRPWHYRLAERAAIRQKEYLRNSHATLQEDHRQYITQQRV